MFTLETKSHFAQKVCKENWDQLGSEFFTASFCLVLNSLDTKALWGENPEARIFT
nr:MAG TPA: hypothetical protein [Caudoviricetes sp.]